MTVTAPFDAPTPTAAVTSSPVAAPFDVSSPAAIVGSRPTAAMFDPAAPTLTVKPLAGFGVSPFGTGGFGL